MKIDKQTKINIQNEINKIINNKREKGTFFITNAEDFLTIIELECRKDIKDFDINKTSANFKKIINTAKILLRMQKSGLLYDNFDCPECNARELTIQKAVSEALIAQIDNYQHALSKIDAFKISNDNYLSETEKEALISQIAIQIQATKRAIYSSLVAESASSPEFTK